MSVQESCNSVKFCYKYVMDKHFLIWLTYFMIHICNIHELQICKNIMSQGRTQDLELGGGASGVSRISARGVLKIRPIRKVGGGGGGAIRFRSDTKRGGGGGRFRSDIRNVGGGQFASGPIPLGTQKISTCTYLRAT